MVFPPPGCFSAKIPERTPEPRVVQDGLGVRGRTTPPRGLESTGIPRLNERPHLLQGYRCSTRMAGPCQPGVDISFRPEGEVVVSGEADIVPCVAKRGHQMNDHLVSEQAAGPDSELDRFSTFCTVCSRPSVRIEDGRDTERVPCAVGVARHTGGLDEVVRGHGRERVGHPHPVSVRSGRDFVCLEKPLE